MPNRAGRDVMVGTFATLALLVLAIAVMTVGGESRLTRGTEFRVTFPNTDGLRLGSPVKMAGVQVGSVREIRLPKDPKSEGIEVVLSVGKDYGPRVRQDSRAALRYLQVLSGEKFVEITPGSSAMPALEPGSAVPASGERELLEQGADIASNINEITLSLKNILGPLEEGEGLLGEMIHDPQFGKEGLAHLHASLENLEILTTRLRRGEGFAGRILFDKEFAQRVDDISVSLGHVTKTLESVSRREGAVGALLNEGGAGQQAIENLRDAAQSIRKIGARMEAREGLVGRLLNDPEYSEKSAADLAAILRNLHEITNKVDTGQGTLGALVNERTLHDGLEEVVAGVNDSKFARWLMRHYQKQGIEVQEEKAAPKPEGEQKP